MHIPKVKGKILSLKLLDQKGFKCPISDGHVCIMRNGETYMEAKLGGELYGVQMKIIPPQAHILTAVKRDLSATDLSTWH